MTRQKMTLKPSEKLVTRLFLSPNLKQDLNILSYSSHDLIKMIRDVAESNPFTELKTPKSSSQNLDWVKDSNQENLVDHLLSQVNMAKFSKKESEVIKYLILNLEVDGYLRVSLNELVGKSVYSLNDLQKALMQLQKLDPVGIGARDLNECLLIQAKQVTNFNSLALEILQQHQLEDLADQEKWQQISSSNEKVLEALQAIQKLDPTPASQFADAEPIQYLVPDLIFSWKDKNLIVEDNRSQIPEIIFNQEEFDSFKEKIGKKEHKYLVHQKKQFDEIKLAINRRYQTLLRIGKFIGKYQGEYFISKDKKDLKPLNLKKVSEQLSLAQSTISRAIKGKYIQFDGNIYSLGMFFPRKSVSNLSQLVIENKIKELIDNEDKSYPLSDEMIVEKFAQLDIQLSRRVITKYRKRLGIVNSYQRRKK